MKKFILFVMSIFTLVSLSSCQKDIDGVYQIQHIKDGEMVVTFEWWYYQVEGDYYYSYDFEEEPTGKFWISKKDLPKMHDEETKKELKEKYNFITGSVHKLVITEDGKYKFVHGQDPDGSEYGWTFENYDKDMLKLYEDSKYWTLYDETYLVKIN